MAQADAVSNAIRTLIPAASTQPSTSSVQAAHAELVTAVVKQAPSPIPLFAGASSPKTRDPRVRAIWESLAAYVTAIFDDRAQNVFCGLEHWPVALLCCPSSEAFSAIKRAANGMAARAS